MFVDPWKNHSEKTLTSRACSQAMKGIRKESDRYAFREFSSARKKRLKAKFYDSNSLPCETYDGVEYIDLSRKRHGQLDPLSILVSREMLDVEKAKLELYESERSPSYAKNEDQNYHKWRDRHSLLAAPLGAEIFLNCERAMPSVVMGSCSYCGDDVDKKVPNARKRFPYSEEANQAAKKMTFKLANYIMKKHYSATLIQRNFRAYMARVSVQRKKAQYLKAITMIKLFYTKRLHRIRRNREKINRRIKAAIVIQCFFRKTLARLRRQLLLLRKLKINAHKICLWYRKMKKLRRKRRGHRRRLDVHATRISSLIRGFLKRRMIKHWHDSQTVISRAWRFNFGRRFGPIYRSVFQYYRRMKIYRAVTRIQRVGRRYNSKCRFSLLRLGLISRFRATNYEEQVDMGNSLMKEMLHDKSWYKPSSSSSSFSYSNSIPEGMKQLSQIAKIILNAQCAIEGLVSHEELMNFSLAHRVALAILVMFAVQNNYCIDYMTWKICRKYFELDNCPLAIQPLERPSPTQSWVGSYCWEVNGLAFHLIPKTKLMIKARLSSSLPDSLLAQAAISRRFQQRLKGCLVSSIERSRLTNPVPYSCATCFEPFLWSRLYFHHINHGCLRNGCWSWVQRDFLRALEKKYLQVTTKVGNHNPHHCSSSSASIPFLSGNNVPKRVLCKDGEFSIEY